MPLVNVIRGERIADAPLNVRTPVVRIPLWMAVTWWLLRGLGRLAVLALRFWWITGPAFVFGWLYLEYGWVGPVALVLTVSAVSCSWFFGHRGSFVRFAWYPVLGRFRL